MKKIEQHDADPPKLKVSSSKDTDEKERENRQYELEYTEDKREHQKRKELYDSNIAKAYAKIWDGHTSEPMKSRIMNLAASESSVRDNPIALVKEG